MLLCLDVLFDVGGEFGNCFLDVFGFESGKVEMCVVMFGFVGWV